MKTLRNLFHSYPFSLRISMLSSISLRMMTSYDRNFESPMPFTTSSHRKEKDFQDIIKGHMTKNGMSSDILLLKQCSQVFSYILNKGFIHAKTAIFVYACPV